MLDKGPDEDWFDSRLIIGLFALSAVALTGLVVHVLAADEPNAGSAHGKLTVSIGVAVHTGIVTAEDTAEDLLRLADGRLYEAKAAGRNAVIPRQERPKLAVV